MKRIKSMLIYGGGLLIVIAFFAAIYRQISLSLYPRYTIGTTFGDYYTSTGLHKVDYFFFVNNVRYDGAGNLRNNALIEGGRYWVRFSYKIPSSSEIIFDKPALDSFKAPVDGLDSLPVFERSDKLNKMIMNYK